MPSAVSLAAVYASLAKPGPACKRCPLPRVGGAGFLQISAGEDSYNNFMILLLYRHDGDALGADALYGFRHVVRSAAYPAGRPSRGSRLSPVCTRSWLISIAARIILLHCPEILTMSISAEKAILRRYSI